MKLIQRVKRRLERRDEEWLARYCTVLALFEELYRAGGEAKTRSPLFVPERKVTVSDLLDIVQKHRIEDLCRLSWAFYDRFGDLLARTSVLNPTFDGSEQVGGADADLILEDCLIDIKTTVDPAVEAIWLYQLLGYVLLDYTDRYRIRKVGIYMARQGVMLQWPLNSLLATMHGTDLPPLSDLRAQFQSVASGLRRA